MRWFFLWPADVFSVHFNKKFCFRVDESAHRARMRFALGAAKAFPFLLKPAVQVGCMKQLEILMMPIDRALRIITADHSFFSFWQ